MSGSRVFSVSIGTKVVEAKKANIVACVLAAIGWAKKGYSPVIRVHGGNPEGVVRVRCEVTERTALGTAKRGPAVATYESHPFATDRDNLPEWARSAIELITTQGEPK